MCKTNGMDASDKIFATGTGRRRSKVILLSFSDFSFPLLFSKNAALEAFWLCPY